MLKPAFIDLSHWNVVPQVPTGHVTPTSIQGVIHKASEGVTSTDDKLHARWVMARDVGLCFGTYHFLRDDDPGDQVAFYIDAVRNAQDRPGDSNDWLWCCDYEVDDVDIPAVIAFMEELEHAIHRSPVLYSGNTLREKLTHPEPRLSKYRLWVPRYSSEEPELPPGWDDWWAWQYTDNGVVEGVDPPTDLNAFRGTVDELRAGWAGRHREPAPGPSPPQPEPIVVRITVEADVPVKVIVE